MDWKFDVKQNISIEKAIYTDILFNFKTLFWANYLVSRCLKRTLQPRLSPSIISLLLYFVRESSFKKHLSIDMQSTIFCGQAEQN